MLEPSPHSRFLQEFRMKSSSLSSVILLSLAVVSTASPAAADVTVKQKHSGKGMVGGMAGDTTQYVKGLKMRMDQPGTAAGNRSTLIDASARQIIVLNHDKKEADVMDL